MAKANNKEWPPRRARFIGGVHYSVDQLIELGPDHDFNVVSEGAAKSTPLSALSDEQLAAELARRQADKKDGKGETPPPPAVDPVSKMTKAAIADELGAAGVNFDPNALRDDLAALLEEHRAKA